MQAGEITKVVAIVGVITLAIVIQLTTQQIPAEVITVIASVITSILGIAVKVSDRNEGD